MSQLEKLKQLQASQTSARQASNMTTFDELIVVEVGCQPTEHFPKLKDANGVKLKDDRGNDLRADKPDGWTHTFAQFGSAKMVKVVLPKKYALDLLKAYKVSGKGYDIKSGNMIFIELEGRIENY